MLRPHDRALTRRRSDPDVGSDLANCSSDSLQPLAAAPSSSAPAAAILAIAPGYLSSSDDESLPRAPPSVRWMMEAPLHLAEPETPPWALVAELSEETGGDVEEGEVIARLEHLYGLRLISFA